MNYLPTSSFRTATAVIGIFAAALIFAGSISIGKADRETPSAILANSITKTRDDIRITVGEPNADRFVPMLTLERWDEVSLSISVPGHETMHEREAVVEGAKIVWGDTKERVRFYELEASEKLPEGGYEVDIVYSEKPDSNVVSFDMEFHNLDLFYQAPLDESPPPVEAAYCEPTACYNEQGDIVAFMPEHIVGSYAAYRADGISGDYSSLGGKNYRTGKAFHIYRPHITDSAGQSVWGELAIDTDAGTLTVTVPQDFLDTATYPVIVDPTFGYDTAGGSATVWGSNKLLSDRQLPSPTLDGVGVFIYWYGSGYFGNASVTMAIYDSDDNLFATSTKIHVTSSAGWKNAFTNFPHVVHTDSYNFAYNANALTFFYYDLASSGNNYGSATSTFGTWPDPAAWADGGVQLNISMYLAFGYTELNGTITASTTWKKEEGPYVVNTSTTIASDVVVDVEPGTIIKFKDDTSLIVNGTLDVRGTTSSPVYFTSFHDDSVGGDTNENGTSTEPAPGDWGRIEIKSGGNADIENAIIRYGGSGTAGMVYNEAGLMDMDNSGVAYSSGTGIYSFFATSTVTNSDIHHNSNGFTILGGSVIVSSSTIWNNVSYGATQSLGATSTMVNNFWGGWVAADYGSNTGPFHPTTNASGAGDEVSSHIDYSSWIEAYLFDPNNASASPPAVNDFSMIIGIDTQYSSSADRAVTKWHNATSSLISMSTSTATTSPEVDLVITDYTQTCDCGVAPGCVLGRWDVSTSPPSVNLNQYGINDCGLNSVETTKTIMHEIGHSIGLAHSTDGNIMKQGKIEQDYLGPQDYHDYNFRWGNWWSKLWGELLEI